MYKFWLLLIVSVGVTNTTKAGVAPIERFELKPL